MKYRTHKSLEYGREGDCMVEKEIYEVQNPIIVRILYILDGVRERPKNIFCIVLHCPLLCSAVLYCTALFPTILCCAVLYCTALYSTIL